MLGFLQRHKGLVVVGALLIAPTLMLFVQTRRGGGQGPIGGALIDVAGFFERGLLFVVGGVMDGIEHYVGSVATYDELVRLRRERISTDVLQARVDELSIENEKLRALANAAADVDGPRPVGARIVGRTGAPLSHVVTIDKGSADGVRRGDGVISIEGVVGVALNVGRAHSDILLLTDPASAIDVLVQHSRARGIVRGRGDVDKYAATVQDFDRLRDVQPGDPLVTAGVGARFPAGLLIGTVVDVDDRDDLTLQATIQPAVDLARLEHVAVLVNREAPSAPTIEDAADDQNVPARRLRRRIKKAAAVVDVATDGGVAVDADVDLSVDDTNVDAGVVSVVKSVDAGVVVVPRDDVDAGVKAAPSPPPPPPPSADAGVAPAKVAPPAPPPATAPPPAATPTAPSPPAAPSPPSTPPSTTGTP